MWVYVKMLEHPVRVSRPDPAFAKVLLTQFGGPDGEFSASWRYLSQRYTMPTNPTRALLTDIGTEELAHLEMVGTMFHMLVRDASPKDLQAAGLDAHFATHGWANYLADSAGNPWIAAYYQSTGDPVADLHEDMAAEQKARAAYERLICLASDPGVIDALRFLRQREVNHFQRFGEALDRVHVYLDDAHHVWPGMDTNHEPGHPASSNVPKEHEPEVDILPADLKGENEAEPKSEPKIKPVAKPTPILPKIEIRPSLG